MEFKSKKIEDKANQEVGNEDKARLKSKAAGKLYRSANNFNEI